MLDDNTVTIIFLALIFLGLGCAYFFTFQIAIGAALREHNGEKPFNRWIFVVIILSILVAYVFMAKPFDSVPDPLGYSPSPVVEFVMVLGFVYVLLEVPYQLVKVAAHRMAEEIQAIGDDKREAARLKSAQTLAIIISEKLKVSCELQAYSTNEEFIFLTYIVNNKPIATRLKLNQADRAESWKKLGEWLIQGYQKEAAAKQ